MLEAKRPALAAGRSRPDLTDQVVVAIDRSSESAAALDAAAQLALAAGAAVHVLHVRREIPTGPITAAEYEESGPAMALVDEAVQSLRDRGVKATGEVHELRSGPLGEAIVAAASACHASLLVIGCRCHHDLGALAFARTAEHVVHHAPCPVLLVR